jgi:hypothetical protein
VGAEGEPEGESVIAKMMKPHSRTQRAAEEKQEKLRQEKAGTRTQRQAGTVATRGQAETVATRGQTVRELGRSQRQT